MTYHFSTAAVPSENRFEYFKQAVERSYVRSDLTCADPAAFSADILVKPFADINLSEISSSKLFADCRKPARQTTSPEVFFLQIVLEGASRVTQGEAALVTRVGEMSLLDTARSYAVDITGPARHLVLEIPRAELAARVGDLSKVTDRAYSARTIEGQLAFGFLRTLFKGEQKVDAVGPALARQAIDLAALALTNGDVDTIKRLSSPVAVSRLRLHHAVECSLEDGLTHCDDVAGMAGISSRYANILLSQEGTSLERLLFRRRIEKCRENLSDLSAINTPIADIALKWGFSSPSHFARAFKQMYGMTARDYRYRVIRAAMDHALGSG